MQVKGKSAWVKKWWGKFILKPLIGSSPFALISLYFGIQAVRNSAVGIIPPLCGILDEYPIMAYLVTGGWFFIWSAAFGYYEEKPKDDFETKDLLKLTNSIERVVGVKSRRFGDFLRALKPGVDPGQVFENITQPKQQVALLAEAIQSFFESIDSDGAQIRVRVASVENSVPVDPWFYYAPPSISPRSDVSDLNNRESAICVCIRSKKIHIVEDTKKEANKKGKKTFFAAKEEDKSDDGSLIVYPVIHHYSNQVVYVVCISSNKSKYFSKKQKNTYDMYIKQFALRMSLEHSLVLIKEKVCPEAT